jgi:hypothetical protein
MPHGARIFQIDFDFFGHELIITPGEGASDAIPLESRPVAHFYSELMKRLEDLGLPVSIHMRPNEVEDNTRFDEDFHHSAYQPEQVNAFHRVNVQADRVLKEFRSGFLGKCSPVHFFWGSFDLAVTRFSGRPAPPHPGGIPNLPDEITREAYSHEVSSAGFWPGGGPLPEPVFYSYAYPEPEGYREARVEPKEAFYHETLREFVLPYEAVRNAADPDAILGAFFESTYVAAADLGKWDRESLERR